jgi:hypothetical protein
MAMGRNWGFAHAVAGKGSTKSPASVSGAGAAVYTESFYRDRTFDARYQVLFGFGCFEILTAPP